MVRSVWGERRGEEEEEERWKKRVFERVCWLCSFVGRSRGRVGGNERRRKCAGVDVEAV